MFLVVLWLWRCSTAVAGTSRSTAWLGRFDHSVGSEKQQKLSATATATTDVPYLEKLDMTSSALSYMKELSGSSPYNPGAAEASGEESFSSFAEAPVDLSSTAKPLIAMESKKLERKTFVQRQRKKTAPPVVALPPSPPPPIAEEEEYDYFSAMQASLPSDLSRLGYSSVRASEQKADYLSHVPGNNDYLSWPPNTPPAEDPSSLWPVKTETGGSLASSLKVGTETNFRGSSLADLNISALSVTTLRAAIARNDYVSSIEPPSQTSADYLSSIERFQQSSRRDDRSQAAYGDTDYLAKIKVDTPPREKEVYSTSSRRSSSSSSSSDVPPPSSPPPPSSTKLEPREDYVAPSGYEYLLKLDSVLKSTGATVLRPPSLPQALEAIKMPRNFFDDSKSKKKEAAPASDGNSYLTSIDSSSSKKKADDDYSISSESFDVKEGPGYLSGLGKSQTASDYLSSMAESLRLPTKQLKQDISKSLAENADKTQTTLRRYASEVASLPSTLLASSSDEKKGEDDVVSVRDLPKAPVLVQKRPALWRKSDAPPSGKEYLSTIGKDKAKKNADYGIAASSPRSTSRQPKDRGYLSTLPKTRRWAPPRVVRSVARAGDRIQSFAVETPARAVRATVGRFNRAPADPKATETTTDASSSSSSSSSEEVEQPPVVVVASPPPPPLPSPNGAADDYLAFVPSGASTTRRREDAPVAGNDYLSYIDSSTTPRAYVASPFSYVVSESAPSDFLRSDRMSWTKEEEEEKRKIPEVWRQLRETLDKPLLGRIGVVGVVFTSFGFNLASALFTLAVAFDPEERRYKEEQAAATSSPLPSPATSA